MNLTEKLKWFNSGIRLGKWRAKVENCQKLTDEQVGEGTSKEIYCGDEYTADFLIGALG